MLLILQKSGYAGQKGERYCSGSTDNVSKQQRFLTQPMYRTQNMVLRAQTEEAINNVGFFQSGNSFDAG
uniref:Uncharacterized protein n=1 Tax=Arion vulgaris TaxID=1028688 RepID=A0A0B6YJ92_9EUPU